MEHLTQCPVCQQTDFKHVLNAVDHHSKESFALQKCTNCQFVFTNPRPSEQAIGPYYAFDQYLSHTSHSKSLLSSVYRIARNIMLSKKYEMFAPYLKGKEAQILDYGCGTADFLAFCQSKGMQVTGYEVDERARATALSVNGIAPFSPAQLQEIPENNFDIITLWHVLEHIHTLNEQIEFFKSRLKKDGTLIIAVPNLVSHDAQKYQEKWAALDVPRHLYHFTPDTLKNLMQRYGFDFAEQKPLILDAFYVSMYSEWNSGAGKIGGLVKAFLEGMISNIAAAKTGNYSSLTYIFRKK